MNLKRAIMVIHDCGEEDLASLVKDAGYTVDIEEAAVDYAWTLLEHTNEDGTFRRGMVSEEILKERLENLHKEISQGVS